MLAVVIHCLISNANFSTHSRQDPHQHCVSAALVDDRASEDCNERVLPRAYEHSVPVDKFPALDEMTIGSFSS